LGLGVQPDRWALGLALVPVADYVAAYEDEMDSLKALDRGLFGGSPEQVPEVYEECSPLTYVDQVRAPVLVLAGESDARCPIRQPGNCRGRRAPGAGPRGVPGSAAGPAPSAGAEQLPGGGAHRASRAGPLPAAPVPGRAATDPAGQRPG